MKRQNSVFAVYGEKIEEHEMMMGPVRGKLAVLLDLLTDSLVVAGQHGIYCRNRQSPDQPSQDMTAIMEGLRHGKELVQAVMDHLQNSRETPSP